MIRHLEFFGWKFAPERRTTVAMELFANFSVEVMEVWEVLG